MMAMAALPSSDIENKPTSSNNMDEIAVVLRRFGDEQSTLLDQFERLSFEVQLNQAILRRSFSEPGAVSRSSQAQALPALMPLVVKSSHHHHHHHQSQKKRQGRRGGSSVSGFTKVLKKLLKPLFVKKCSSSTTNNNNNIIINKNGARNHEVPDPKNPKFFKAFSRSLRI